MEVIDARYARARLEDHRRGRDWTSKRAHAGFIHAGHAHDTGGPERVLVAQQLSQPLTFGPVFEAAAPHGLQDSLGAGAAIRLQRGLGHLIERPALDYVAEPDLSKRKPCQPRTPGFELQISARISRDHGDNRVMAQATLTISCSCPLTTTVSPISLPIRACARGETYDKVPCAGLASSVPTMR